MSRHWLNTASDEIRGNVSNCPISNNIRNSSQILEQQQQVVVEEEEEEEQQQQQ